MTTLLPFYNDPVKTVLLGTRSAETDTLIARRRALGHDLYDEVWEGDYHMSPAPHWQHGIVGSEVRATLRPFARRAGLRATDPFNLGSPADYRVPDGGFHRASPAGAWVSQATIVLEVVSPDDETFEKFGFYARHGVEEIVVADPATHRVRFFARDGRGGEVYEEVAASTILGVTSAEVEAEVDWP